MPQTGVRALVVADVGAAMPSSFHAMRTVRTPLDLIVSLADPPDRVMLVGRFAEEHCFAAFIRETCPTTEIVCQRNASSGHVVP